MTGADRLAVIEIGTKGVRLLVIERRAAPEGMAVVRTAGELGLLGEGLAVNAGAMQRQNIEHTLRIVAGFLAVAAREGVPDVTVVGTEVFRRAVNVGAFTAGLPADVRLRVLTPVEEAVGSFLAAGWGFRKAVASGGRLLLLDLGGGSLEVIAGSQGCPARPRAAISVAALGTLALRGVWRQAPSRQREAALRQHVAEALTPHEAALAELAPAPGGPPLLVAGLGSTVVDSAWALRRGTRDQFASRKVHGLSSSIEELDGLRRRLLAASWRGPGGLAEELGLRDLLGHQLGLAALLEVLRRLGAPAVTACGTGLRYGLAFALLHGVPLRLADPAE